MQKASVFSRVVLMMLVVGCAALTVLPSAKASAQSGKVKGVRDTDDVLVSLKTIPVPKPANLAQYVQNEAVAIKLGKALFWDMQAGGDGKQSCASCHSAAGADNRIRNTLNPHGSTEYLANAVVTASMFPIQTSLVVGSAGVSQTDFIGLADPWRNNSNFLADLGKPMPDAVFNIGGANIRQVTGRQAPSVINSVYSYRFFWDGRARETFNGVNPFGDTPAAGKPQILQVGTNGLLSLVSLSLNNGSAASQAVGPATNSNSQ